MTREQYLKKEIKEHGYSIKEFAREIEIPYTTLATMLGDGKIGGASVCNVIKICHGLGMTVEELMSLPGMPEEEHFFISPHEKKLVEGYRKYKDMQEAVDCLLEITKNPPDLQ